MSLMVDLMVIFILSFKKVHLGIFADHAPASHVIQFRVPDRSKRAGQGKTGEAGVAKREKKSHISRPERASPSIRNTCRAAPSYKHRPSRRRLPPPNPSPKPYSIPELGFLAASTASTAAPSYLPPPVSRLSSPPGSRFRAPLC